MAKSKLVRNSGAKKCLNEDDFKLLPRKELPQLVLGIKVPWQAFDDETMACHYDFTSDRTWVKINHQTAGLGCHHHYLHATLLQPKSELVTGGMALLSDKWLNSNTGIGGLGLDQLSEYQDDLKAIFNADCNLSYADFEEGYYPIDLKYINQLTSEILPADLDNLIIWRNGFQRAAGSGKRFVLAILGQNSD